MLVARWRIFRRPIIAEPDHVVLYTKATIALHNFLRTTESFVYCPNGFIDAEDGAGNVINGTWRDDSSIVSGLESIGQIRGN
uniref:DDE Tnp4 domain-containing protein n=1 Tax=Amphimedon queenslandica TaxID=400682 RepID=A0A1X7V7X1_AMPQE